MNSFEQIENDFIFYKNEEKRAIIRFCEGFNKPYWAEFFGNGYLPDKIGRYKTLEGAKKAVIKYVKNFDNKYLRINKNTLIFDIITF